MAKVSLATYTMKLRERMKGDALPLDDTHLQTSFLEEFRLYASSIQEQHTLNDESRSVLSVLELHEEEGVVWGRVNAGAYGYGRDVVASATNKKVHRVQPTEAVLHPFYFMLSVHPASNRAIYVLQRHGNTGVHSSFTKGFQKFFHNRNPGLIFDVMRHVPREVLDYLEFGGLKKVEYTAYEMPKYLEDRVKFQGAMEGKIVVRTSITARRRGELLPKPAWVDKVVKQRVRKIKLTEFDTGGEAEVNDISLTFHYNGGQRKLDFARPDALNPYVDMSEIVPPMPDGHPDPLALHRAALSLRDEIREEMSHG